MASSASKPRPRAMDVEPILAVLQRWVATPGQLRYRETVRGCLQPAILESHVGLITALRAGPCQQGALPQSAVEAAFQRLAASREGDWHLGAQQAAYAKSAAAMVRAMLRDVGQSLGKAAARGTEPKWLAAFRAKDRPKERFRKTCS